MPLLLEAPATYFRLAVSPHELDRWDSLQRAALIIVDFLVHAATLIERRPSVLAPRDLAALLPAACILTLSPFAFDYERPPTIS